MNFINFSFYLHFHNLFCILDIYSSSRIPPQFIHNLRCFTVIGIQIGIIVCCQFFMPRLLGTYFLGAEKFVQNVYVSQHLHTVNPFNFAATKFCVLRALKICFFLIVLICFNDEQIYSQILIFAFL